MVGFVSRRRRRRLVIVVAGLLAASLAAVPAAVAGPVARDFTGTALNIVPSGQFGSVPPPAGADRQARMYDGLTPLFDRVDTADINRLFKSAKFGTAGQGPTRTEAVPRAGVTLVRDGFNVPHITATTKDGAIFAAGWVVAEDRGLLLEQARNNARVAAIDAPNLGALRLITELRNFAPSAQTEATVARQTQVLQAAGANGRLLIHDIDVFISGINAYLARNSPGAAPWTRNDVYALNALKGQFLGQGGGREVRNAEFLSGLTRRLGATRAFSVFNDMRNRNDPEVSHSIDGTFPYELSIPRSRAGNVVVDNGSYQPIEFLPPASASVAAASTRETASNVLMVTGARSASGDPIMVGGPQLGYFYPGLTLEMDVQAPGFNWRGVTSAPFPGYMLHGHGPDWATTLTSAGGDIIDQYVETLCGGSDRKYVFRGRCRDMGTFNAGVIRGSGGGADTQVTFNTTVHGSVVGYARVRGRRVAISSRRSSYGRDTLDQLLFQDMSYTGRIRNARDFFRAAAKSPQTFNAFYMDDRDLAVYVTGRLPLRARNVDPGLPTDGRGGYEWRGFLFDSGHPQGTNPRNGTLINWNNPTAAGFTASDNQWGHGPLQRNLLLTRAIGQRRRHTPASVTAAMNQAATQDTRAVLFVPTLGQVLRSTSPPSSRARQMLDLLERWRARGGSRLDRNLDGRIDDPGAAILDASWDRMADAAMRPWIGSQLDQLAGLQGRFDLPPSGQFNGWHHYMSKDFRRLLGQRVRGPLRNRYCGRGNLQRCSRSLWAALDAAGTELARTQGANPARWRADATRERIRFVPGLLPLTIRYTNRPSGFQQITTFTGHGPR